MSVMHAFLFGVTLAVAVGPIALLIMNTSLQAGFRAGISCALGATLADLIFALIAFHLADQLVPLLQEHARLVQLLAAAVLILFALHMLYQLKRAANAMPAPAHSSKRYFFTTFALTVVNPLTVLAFGSFALQLAANQTQAAASVLALSAAAGTGSIAVLMVLGAGGLGRLLGNGSWLRALNALSAVGILLFGLRGVWLAI
jgi:threonine/homoserine/homoserine lactone efflux protein